MKRLVFLLSLLLVSATIGQPVYTPMWYDAADGTYLYPQNAPSNVAIYDTGVIKALAGILPDIYPAADSTTAVQILKADGATQVTAFDTTNSRLIVGTGTSTADFAVKPDTDAAVYLGRAAIGSPAGLSDYAIFAHFDNYNSTQYAIRQQGAGGNTIVNSPSTLYFAINSTGIGAFASTGFSSGSITPWSKLSVDGGDISVRDVTDLASESLTNGALTAGASWTAANDCSLAGDAATWTYSAGTASTLTQASGTLAIAGIADAWYYLTYTVSGVSGSPTANITTAFASATTALTITNGAKTLIFKSAASPGDFVITSTLTAGQAFTIDTMSLKMIIGGDVMSAGVGRFRQSYYTDLNGTTFRDCQIKLDGTLGYDSSTIAGKTNVVDLPKTDTISRLRPVVYEPKSRRQVPYEVDVTTETSEEVEITADEAFETVDVNVPVAQPKADPNGPAIDPDIYSKAETVYAVQDGKVIECVKRVPLTMKVSQKRLKEGCRLDEKTGKIYQTVKSTKTEKVTRYREEYTDDGVGFTQYGLIAEEVAEVDPSLVFYDPDGKIAGVHYGKQLTVLMLKKIQELEARVAALEAAKEIVK